MLSISSQYARMINQALPVKKTRTNETDREITQLSTKNAGVTWVKIPANIKGNLLDDVTIMI